MIGLFLNEDFIQAMENWSVPAKKGFDIYKGAWEFDLDSMVPNIKSVEQN